MTESTVRLWAFHPSGIRVEFTLPLTTFDEASSAIDQLLKANFLSTPPGVEADKSQFTIDCVVKRTKVNDDGSETPVIFFYPVGWEYPAVRHYLNTDEDRQQFEAAAGLRLDQMPEHIGRESISRKTPGKLSVYLQETKPFEIVCRENPRYNPDEPVAQRKPKRLFVVYGSALHVAGEPSADAPKVRTMTVTHLQVRKHEGNWVYHFYNDHEEAWSSDEQVARAVGCSDSEIKRWHKQGGYEGALPSPQTINVVWARRKNARSDADGYWKAQTVDFLF